MAILEVGKPTLRDLRAELEAEEEQRLRAAGWEHVLWGNKIWSAWLWRRKLATGETIMVSRPVAMEATERMGLTAEGGK